MQALQLGVFISYCHGFKELSLLTWWNLRLWLDIGCAILSLTQKSSSMQLRWRLLNAIVNLTRIW